MAHLAFARRARGVRGRLLVVLLGFGVCLDVLMLIVLMVISSSCLPFVFVFTPVAAASSSGLSWAHVAPGVRTLAAFGRLRCRRGYAPVPVVAVWPPCILLARLVGACAVLVCLWSCRVLGVTCSTCMVIWHGHLSGRLCLLAVVGQRRRQAGFIRPCGH